MVKLDMTAMNSISSTSSQSSSSERNSFHIYNNSTSNDVNISSTNCNNNNRTSLTISPQLIAKKARINAEWQDLVYREALRMSGSLRQILLQNINNNVRSQLVIYTYATKQSLSH